MDKSITILDGAPRGFQLAPQLDIIGGIPGKTNVIRQTFRSWNFSFVVAGAGWYELNGVRYPVKAPMVLTQWPGEPMFYGPETSWDELYLIYPESAGAALGAAGLSSPERFLWEIRDSEHFFRQFDAFLELLRDGSCRETADRVDLAAARLILESLLEEHVSCTGRFERRIRAVAGRFQEFPGGRYDLDELAAEIGISLSTFRRYFNIYFGCPPADYLLDCRIRRAQKLLIAGKRDIGDVAHECGFADQLYFSRRFRLACGMPPSEYRRHYRGLG